MALGRKDRPERLANDINAKTVKGPGAKTGAPGTDPGGKGKTKGKKSMKLKLAVGVVVLLVAGAGAKFTVLAPSSSAEAAKPQPGPVIPLDETTLNLTDGHYLRMKVALQTTKGTNTELDTSQAAQLVIDEYSNLTVAQLTGNAARTKVKDELVVKLQKAYPKEIMDAFYTEFVMTG
ncbi:MAG: flagellar basal body-associated FliL family protein [Actinomycetota bacterium]|nr:flagellar basal body-associated FliL family protein [Actinomycetota bacterium]MDQ2958779.1 flagellar basal body-associated FliL family protein [Actinomycetota bacterium]